MPAMINGKLTQPLPVQSCVRPGDPLSTLLFNEVIKKERQVQDCKMGNRYKYYVMQTTEDDLEKLTNIFNTIRNKIQYDNISKKKQMNDNIEISTNIRGNEI